jgi:hypothetical protein
MLSTGKGMDICGGNAKWYDHFGKHTGTVLFYKTKTPNTDLAISLLGIYPKGK